MTPRALRGPLIADTLESGIVWNNHEQAPLLGYALAVDEGSGELVIVAGLDGVWVLSMYNWHLPDRLITKTWTVTP